MDRTKNVVEKLFGTKSRRNFLGILKRKIEVFIETKNIFNVKIYIGSWSNFENEI